MPRCRHAQLRILWVGAMMLAMPRPAQAADSAAELLSAVDKVVGGRADQYLLMEMTTEEAGKAKRQLTFAATIKGAEFRRIEFLAPGDVKGTRILVLSTDQTYVYLPAFHKVRRIATHVKEQGFMGSAWDNDDFSLATYGKVFLAEAVVGHDDYYTLKLTRRPGVEFLYPRIEIDARRDQNAPVAIRYFNDTGALLKTETRTELTCQGTICVPKVVVMVDHSRGDIKTTMVMKDWKVNRGVSDSFFTVRALQRGE
jgi:hypothetical protein